jgi:hypothetical protein
MDGGHPPGKTIVSTVWQHPLDKTKKLHILLEGPPDCYFASPAERQARLRAACRNAVAYKYGVPGHPVGEDTQPQTQDTPNTLTFQDKDTQVQGDWLGRDTELDTQTLEPATLPMFPEDIWEPTQVMPAVEPICAAPGAKEHARSRSPKLRPGHASYELP